jgi:2-hydroxychromene-2-carboxylate isomerase
MTASALSFVFDYISPYAYLASTQIRSLAAKHGREVEAVPVLFAAMLEANDTRGPAEIPAKRAYLFKDVVRIARRLGVSIEAPATHPFNPLLALRVTTAVDDAEGRWRLVDALYAATWKRELRIDDPEVCARVVSEAGFDGASLVAQATSSNVKERLRSQTTQAIGSGVFGVPTTIADGELFWGVEALPHLERFLLGEDPVSPVLVARWSKVTPSASRA